MERIDGVSLNRYLAEHGGGDEPALRLMSKVCRAVQYAHQRGIIHRDLKPGNILVAADGEPKVLDFGLAKAMEVDSALSIDGEVVGTPAFMSPEQAAARNDQVDTRSDVYSLGVILYNLLTGRHPHDLSGSTLEVMKRVAEQGILSPRKARPDLSVDLAAILSKALAHEPDERYVSAGALADDLDHYLVGDPVAARSSAVALYHLGKDVKKYRGRLAGDRGGARAGAGNWRLRVFSRPKVPAGQAAQ